MTRMKLPQYCQWHRDRHGKDRVYFRRDKHTKRIPMPAPDAPEFEEAYQAARAGTPLLLGADRSRAGTLNAAAVAYYQSPKFRGMAQNTITNWRYEFDRFRCETTAENPVPRGERPLRALDHGHLAKIIGRMEPMRQHTTLKVLRLFFDWCITEQLVDANPARAIKAMKRPKSTGHHPWSEKDIARFETAHPIGTMPRLAMTILLYTGMRISDLRLFGPDNLVNGTVRFTPIKTARTTAITLAFPAHPELLRVIKATPRSIRATSFVYSERQAPYAPGVLSNAMRDWCDAARLPMCSAHGLRKAIVRRLLEAGATEYQVAAITGHSDLDEIRTYAQELDNGLLGRSAIGLLAQPDPQTFPQPSRQGWGKSRKTQRNQ